MMKALLTILLLSGVALSQTITVGTATSYQTMKGWQASGDTGVIEYISRAPANWNNTVLDNNVDLGINRVRIGLHSGIAENSTAYYGNFLANGQDADVGGGVALWTAVKNNWRVPVNDNADPNSINASGFKWDMVDHQIDYVVEPMRTKLAARGESLFFVVTYIHFSTLNQLHIDTPAEYGELILATWQHIQTDYGYVPDALEIFLEPDNGDAQVTASEMAAMIVAARDRLVAAGFAKPYIIAPSVFAGQDAGTYYNSIKTANATAAGYIDEIGYHRYSPVDNTELAAVRTVADADSKNMAMNEYIAATMQMLWDDLETGRNSSWEQYALAYELPSDDGSAYYVVTPTTFAIAESALSKWFRHIFRYVRLGAVMKGVTNSDSNFRGLPFRNSNGTYVVAIKASAAGTATIAGLPAGTYGVRRSYGDGVTAPTTYFTDVGNQTITSSQNVTVAFTGAGYATVFDVNYLTGSGPTLRYFFNTAPPVAQQFAEGRLSRISG